MEQLYFSEPQGVLSLRWKLKKETAMDLLKFLPLYLLRLFWPKLFFQQKTTS